MKTKIEHILCPYYQFENLDIDKVSKCIDETLINKFNGQNVVLRGIQLEKHDLPKEQFIQHIVGTGTDRYSIESKNEVNVADRYIDLFGFACVAKSPMTLSVLEGFHKWQL